jgi:fatty acid desaturase
MVIKYARLICEHSIVHSAAPAYQTTRTTIPTRLESVFVLPRNIGYHIEHHWYPSVPFYRLPELHERLLQVPDFRRHANIKRSVIHSLVECTSGVAAISGPSRRCSTSS